MPLSIVHYNDPVLRRKGEKITAFDAPLRRFAAEMIETMHEAGGIGLAAQQVGRAVRVCVVDLRVSDAEYDWVLDGARPPKDLFMPMTLANPEVTAVRGTDKVAYEEGCLSFPQIRGEVIRPDEITVKFQDEHGGRHVLACNGLLARCIQHEADHLNGVLFIERMDKATRESVDEAVKTLAKKTRELGPAAVKPDGFGRPAS